jgi:hypothetical protein
MPFPLFHAYLHDRYKPLFWIFLTGTFIFMYVQVLQTKPLNNKSAPFGIVSLEIAGSYSKASAIIQSWKIENIPIHNNTGKRNLLDRARINIRWDFPFIFFYTLLCIVVISWLREESQPFNAPKINLLKKLSDAADSHPVFVTNLLIRFAITAGIMDILENTGMFITIHSVENNIPMAVNVPLFTSIAAWTKIILLGILLLYILFMLIFKNRALQVLTVYLHSRVAQLYRYRVIFIGIAGFAGSIWLLDQGQDLLVNSNAEDTGVVLFLLMVTITAFVNWYFAKLFFNKTDGEGIFTIKEPAIVDPDKLKSEKKVSRFLGVSTFILPAVGILNALHGTDITYVMDFFPAYAMLVVLLAIFFLFIQHRIAEKLYDWLVDKKKEPFAKKFSIFVIVLFMFIVPAIIRFLNNGTIHQPTSLIWLYWDLISLASGFYVFISVRTSIFQHKIPFGNSIGLIAWLMAVACVLVFFVANVYPLMFARWENHYTTLPLLLCGIVAYTCLFTIFIRTGQKMKVNLVLFIIITGLMISAIAVNGYHNVRTHRAVKSKNITPLGDYFKEWVLRRKDEFRGSGRYTIFLVNSYGGGIRAAAYTSMVLNWLDSMSITKGKKAFEHYTFSISGASGGTIGAAIQCAYRQRCLDSSANYYSKDSFINFYQGDFLTPVLIPDMGRDVFASAIGGAPWLDRAGIQEETWEVIMARKFNLDIGHDFDSLWMAGMPSSYEVPLLFSNTLNVDDGLKGIMAPVLLDPGDFPATIFIRQRLDSINAHVKLDTGRGAEKDSLSLSLMTGAFLSARFPIISPAGKMTAGFHFMDGGGKDNSGASTSELIYKALLRYIQASKDTLFTQLASKIDFCFVSVNNSPLYKTDPRQLVENRFELISPLVGIINSGINGNAHAADSALAGYNNKMADKTKEIMTYYYPVYPNAVFIPPDSNYKAILPLGWQISASALKRLRASFTKENIDSPGSSNLQMILNKIK